MNIRNLFKKNDDTPKDVVKTDTGIIGAKIPDKTGKETKEFEAIFTVKSKQFVFQNGVIIGNFNTNIGNSFSLKYHYDNTANFDDFIVSVKRFVTLSDSIVTESDIERLKIEYSKHSGK